MQIILNSAGVRFKRSSLEQRLDRLIFCVFGLLASICLVDAVGSALWVNTVRWQLQGRALADQSASLPLPAHSG